MPLALAAAVVIGYQTLAALAETYLQMMATKYESSSQLPADVARSAPRYDFVASEELALGAKVLSAARSAGSGS